MTNDEIKIVGKNVKDMYGALMGKVLGTTTDVDGTIQTVGIDCGIDGLKQIPFEQLVVQEEVVIFIPKWRLDAQRLLREKELALKRLKALVEIVSQNDDMKDDAAIIHEKYKAKLTSLNEFEEEIKATLDARTVELNEQLKAVKLLVFDAEMQHRSSDISEEAFESVKLHTNGLIDHITHESAEISNIQRRINDISMEIEQIAELPAHPIQESAVSYLDDASESEVEAKLPEAPTDEPTEVAVAPQITVPESSPSEVTPVQSKHESESRTPVHATEAAPESSPEASPESPDTKADEESNWLARMQSQ